MTDFYGGADVFGKELLSELKRAVSDIFSPYLDQKIMDKLINEPIAYLKEEILSNGFFYVPNPSDMTRLTAKLLRLTSNP